MWIEFLKNNVYLLLLFLTTTEWPITSFVAAWLSAQWVLIFSYVIVIAFVWDIIWDVIAYFFGRFFAQLIKKIKFLKRFHDFENQKNFLTKLSNKTPLFYFLLIKITPYIATPSLIYMWMKKMKFRKFFFYSFCTSIIVKTVYLFLWYIWSVSLKQLTNFVDWWKQVAIYVIGGLFILWGIKILYYYLSKILRKKID